METLNTIGQFLFTNANFLIGFILPPFIEWFNKDIDEMEDLKRFYAGTCVCILIAAFLQWNALVEGTPQIFFNNACVIFTEWQLIERSYFETSWLKYFMQRRLFRKNPLDNAVG